MELKSTIHKTYSYPCTIHETYGNTPIINQLN